ncbi:hypothetical protein BGX24_005568, partial [Mortierella sp. AD032]
MEHHFQQHWIRGMGRGANMAMFSLDASQDTPERLCGPSTRALSKRKQNSSSYNEDAASKRSRQITANTRKRATRAAPENGTATAPATAPAPAPAPIQSPTQTQTPSKTKKRSNWRTKSKPESFTPMAASPIASDASTSAQDLRGPMSSMKGQELTQARKESANAVLKSILADKNASSTLKLYQYNLRLWQEQENVEENEAQELEMDPEPELEHSSKSVPRWSALVPPANMDPVDWQIKFALDADREVSGADVYPQTESLTDGEDVMGAPSKETEQASCSSAQPAPKKMVNTISTFAEREFT